MAFDDLTQFLQATADAGELERVEIPLDPDQEIAAVTQEICREFRTQSPAIMIENVAQSEIPVVANLFGHEARFLRSLGGVDFSEVIDRVRSVLNPFPAVSRDWKFTAGTNPATERGRLLPRVIRRGNCQQVVKLGKELNLQELPQLHCWADESHAALTAAVVVTEHEEHGVCLDRLSAAIADRDRMALHCDSRSPVMKSWQIAQQTVQPVPIALSFGGDPLLGYVASLPLPPTLNPWIFSGMLRNEGVNLIRARTVELDVPADAEIILEGYLDPALPETEVTLARADGVLRTLHNLPMMRVTGMTHRANPLLPVMIHGFDFQEEKVTARLTERLLLEAAQFLNPSILDLHLAVDGNQQQAVLLSTGTCDDFQIHRMFQAVASLPMLDQAACLIAVRPEIDLRDPAAVWREVYYSIGSSAIGPTSTSFDQHSVCWINATRSIPTPQRCWSSQSVLQRIAQRLGEHGVISEDFS